MNPESRDIGLDLGNDAGAGHARQRGEDIAVRMRSAQFPAHGTPEWHENRLFGQAISDSTSDHQQHPATETRGGVDPDSDTNWSDMAETRGD